MGQEITDLLVSATGISSLNTVYRALNVYLDKATSSLAADIIKITDERRYSHLSSFFNFIKTNLEDKFDNPCNVPVMTGIHLRPHDLRRHSATFASRSGVPVEIVSKR